MKRTLLSVLALALSVTLTACSQNNENGETPQPETEEPAAPDTAQAVVYMTRNITPERLMAIYEALGREATGNVAVKLSTGEPGEHNYLQPSLIEGLVRRVNGTIVECNTAYGGGRSNTAAHLQAAEDHGFTAIATVDIMDAEGETRLPMEGTSNMTSWGRTTRITTLRSYCPISRGMRWPVLEVQ